MPRVASPVEYVLAGDEPGMERRMEMPNPALCNSLSPISEAVNTCDEIIVSDGTRTSKARQRSDDHD
jgi:hypothetical protein